MSMLKDVSNKTIYLVVDNDSILHASINEKDAENFLCELIEDEIDEALSEEGLSVESIGADELEKYIDDNNLDNTDVKLDSVYVPVYSDVNMKLETSNGKIVIIHDILEVLQEGD